MTGATYDAGALIAAERGSARMWALHRRLLERGVRPTLPAVALGQAWRGGSQARLSHLLRGCRIAPFAEADARVVGEALAASGTRDLVDAAVLVGASIRGDLIVTSDPRDLERVGSALGVRPQFHLV